jgi:glycosyltransferase involved in cell wall biosynthesis
MTTRGPVQPDALVTVLIPTFNRRRYLGQAIRSVVEQTYPHLEIFVINDGGPSVRDIVEGFNDPRLTLLERRQNRGKAASLNEALQHAAGRYVCYLDDDDLYYPHHVGRLVETLESCDQGVAYSDLYKVHCRVLPDGRRQVLGKVVNISRDFDRFFMLYFNHTLHVSLMHRRDLLDKTGPYNEDIRILIDWDITRRLAFFTDFVHLPEVTGEFFTPVGDCDRISVRMRKNEVDYRKNVLMIRSNRPPKPWPCMKDLALVVPIAPGDSAMAERIGKFWGQTVWPFELILPLEPGEANRLSTSLPNTRVVPIRAGASLGTKVDAALAASDADFIAVVPPETPVHELWIEPAAWALQHHASANQAIQLCDRQAQPLPAVFRAEELRRGRRGRGDVDFLASLRQAGLEFRAAVQNELPLQFDLLLESAKAMETDGNWPQAAALYEQARRGGANVDWMQLAQARALAEVPASSAAARELCGQINSRRPTVESLLLEARLHRRAENIEQAVVLLERARRVLQRKAQACT